MLISILHRINSLIKTISFLLHWKWRYFKIHYRQPWFRCHTRVFTLDDDYSLFTRCQTIIRIKKKTSSGKIIRSWTRAWSFFYWKQNVPHLSYCSYTVWWMWKAGGRIKECVLLHRQDDNCVSSLFINYTLQLIDLLFVV